MKDLKTLIKEGVDRNIIVFDRDGEQDVITSKILLYILWNSCYAPPNTSFVPTIIYVPPLVKLDDNYFSDSAYTIKFITEEGLSKGGKYMNYYNEEIQGSLPYDKERLILATDGNHCLLGSV